MPHTAEQSDEIPERASERPSKPPRWTTVVPTMLAAVALAVAGWALARPLLDAHRSPTEQQTTVAKGRACAAYNRVRDAVALQTQVDIGTDQIAVQAVAANARLAMSVGSDHLIANLTPETPPELATAMRELASELQILTINALAGAPDNDTSQIGRLRSIEAKSEEIVGLCQ